MHIFLQTTGHLKVGVICHMVKTNAVFLRQQESFCISYTKTKQSSVSFFFFIRIAIVSATPPAHHPDK